MILLTKKSSVIAKNNVSGTIEPKFFFCSVLCDFNCNGKDSKISNCKEKILSFFQHKNVRNLQILSTMELSSQKRESQISSVLSVRASHLG